jgi:hypothetical protein
VSGLTPEHVQAMAAAVGLSLTGDDLTEVTHRLNGLLEALQPLDDLPLDSVEPLPILPDEGSR